MKDYEVVNLRAVSAPAHAYHVVSTSQGLRIKLPGDHLDVTDSVGSVLRHRILSIYARRLAARVAAKEVL